MSFDFSLYDYEPTDETPKESTKVDKSNMQTKIPVSEAEFDFNAYDYDNSDLVISTSKRISL